MSTNKQKVAKGKKRQSSAADDRLLDFETEEKRTISTQILVYDAFYIWLPG